MGAFYTCYQDRVPDYLVPFIAAPAMQRLRDVDMNCGMTYTAFPFFTKVKPYSRLSHSIGVAMIIDAYTHDPVQALSGLFHDIATPVFSHVVDFMNNDHLAQESTEGRTAELIMADRQIMKKLDKMHIEVARVVDYHVYPIADNQAPRLSADRLEYTLSNMVNYHFVDAAEMRRLYQDVAVGVNEEECEELMFRSPEAARVFALQALQCSRVYTADADRYAMEVLAHILRDACHEGLLQENDLYGQEADVIGCLLSHEVYRTRWQAFTKLSRMAVSPEAEDESWLCINAKKRLIDPYVKDQGRVSSLCQDVRKQQEAFLQTSFDYYMKGYEK